jgi:hypothetical protein
VEECVRRAERFVEGDQRSGRYFDGAAVDDQFLGSRLVLS